MSETALDERERLIDERVRARQVAIKARTEREQIEAEIKQVRRDRKAAIAERARGRNAPDPAALEVQERELRRAADRLSEETKGAAAASQQAVKDLERLHDRRFDEFAEHAEQLTQEAMSRLEDIEGEYRAAFDAVEAANREWRRISVDRNRGMTARMGPADKAANLHRKNAIQTPPPNPLRPPAEVFGALAPRPVNLTPAGVEDAAA